MLRSRIIPVLLVQNKGLVKTVKFNEGKYVGDPLNAVRIFNEKEADELTVFDIDATVNGREPDYKMIENLATECRMPLCYGGGITSLDQALRILSLGVEKIALSSAAVENPQLISQIAEQVGRQSVVVVADVKKKLFGGYKVCTHNGKKAANIELLDFVKKAEELGAGEIVVNNIDLDGTMKGYDANLVKLLKETVTVPLTICGGASNLDDISHLVHQYSPIGLAAGSLFVFKGKYRAVLINYPNNAEKIRLFD
ncbi:AglZ/HisF2 family acetamidino modification protein [Enterovibrio makurazakiensis]|uniref:AglZ/HisF2 family acetamidino modification protein n=1 Tax=Enterovibrio makurazakiensis TaxID=2910232 RepID=UPI003D21E641